jgi:predicted glycosyltransferase
MAGLRIAFYAVNGLGLGHVTRLLAIARAVRRLEPGAEILFLTSSDADGVIYGEGFAAVKLPSKTIREEVGLSKRVYLKLIQTVTWNAIGAFDPDVLVVDTYPSGSVEELIPVLRWRQRNVFVFREQRSESFQSALLQASLPLYDMLIIPHDDVARAGTLPEPGKARAVGTILIREKDELHRRDSARRILGLDQDALLYYASFGGGGDGEAARALGLTVRAVRERGDARLVVAAGPLLRNRIGDCGSGVHILAGRYPMLDVLPAFDAAVSAAGYNSVHELLFAGVPSVVIPFGRVLDDQERRARELAAAGACLCCAPLTKDNLRDALDRLGSAEVRRNLSRQAARTVRRNGAQDAARAILELA